MKWLFAILVALNIIVFGNVVASKLMRPAHTAAQAEAPAAPATPTPAASGTEPVITINPPEPASAVAPPPVAKTRAELRAEAAAKARAEAAAKARAETQAQSSTTPAAPINCSATAVLPEDDYHRIKGLLSRWPHAASRFVEQGGGSTQAAPASRRVRYMVSIDGGADMRARLKEQGFDTAINNGRLSLGVFNRKNDAEALLARAKINGFSQAEITQLGGTPTESPPATSLSVAKMRITFIQIDDQAAQDINQIIQRYGRLQRGACKK